MIGTNNLPQDEPSEIAAGIRAIVAEIQTLSPTSIILLHAIPPRGVAPEDPMRKRAAETNRMTRSLADGTQILWIDPWPVLLEEDRTPRRGFLAGDGVHLGPRGYEAWSKKLGKHVKRPASPKPPAERKVLD